MVVQTKAIVSRKELVVAFVRTVGALVALLLAPGIVNL